MHEERHYDRIQITPFILKWHFTLQTWYSLNCYFLNVARLTLIILAVSRRAGFVSCQKNNMLILSFLYRERK